jgi:hypothetical protein
MLKLEEYLKQGSLFNTLFTMDSLEGININDIPKMDMMLSMNHGQRTVYDAIGTKTINEVAEMLSLLNRDKWKKSILLESNNDDIGMINTRKLTETIIENESRTNNRDNINKVSAYNSDEMINNDGSNSISNEGLDNTKTRTITDGIYDINNAYKNLSSMSKNNIMEMIIKDVSNFMTLSIY